LPELSRKAWKHKINELRGRRKRLNKRIKAAKAQGTAGSGNNGHLHALEKEKDKIVVELDRLEEVGIRLAYAYDGGASKAARHRYGELASKTTEEIEAFIEDIDKEIDRGTSSSYSAQIQKLEAEKVKSRRFCNFLQARYLLSIAP